MPVDRHVWLVATVALLVGLTGASPPLASADIEDSPARLTFERTLANQDPQVLVSLGPNHSTFVATDRDERDAVVSVRRLTQRGKVQWSRTWEADGLHIDHVFATAITVNRADHGLYVGGWASCRVNETGLDVLGPAYVRRYNLSGRLSWTVWTGTCPSSTSQPAPPPMIVTGLDAARDAVAVSLNESRSCCGEFVKDGFVRLYSDSGTLVWDTPVILPARAEAELGLEDVTMSRRAVVAGGSVQKANLRDRQALLVGLRRHDGAMTWTRAIEGPGRKDIDDIWSVSAAGGTLAVAGTFRVDAKRGAVQLVQRRRLDGVRIWSREDPHASLVEALRGHGVLSVGEFERFVIRRHRPDGSVKWRFHWSDRSKDGFLDSFSAKRHTGAVGGFVERPSEYVAKVWRWSW